MYLELQAAYTSVTTLTKLLKAANSLSNYNEIVGAISEVNTKLMQAQTAGMAALEKQQAQASRISDLEKELTNLKNWEAEASNYETLEVARGVFAYVIKGNVKRMTSAEKLCSNCFLQNKKSFLQESREHRDYCLACHRCNAKVIFHNYSYNS